jgi:diguanylate cyclase (GGDEF)-like protein/PAS domain S-box-containing protein
LAADAACFPDLPQIAEQRLRDLLEETPIGHADLGADGMVRHVNAALSAMLGVSEHQLIGRKWLSLLAPVDRAVVGTAMKRLAAGAAPHMEGEHLLVQQDGSMLPAYVFLRAQAVGTTSESSAGAMGALTDQPAAGQQPAGITALVLDRSVRHAAFRALERNQRLLAAAERFAHLGSWQQDLTTGETTWSAELHRLLGAEPGFLEPGPETLLTVVHPDDQAALLAAAGGPEGPEDAAEDIRVHGPNGSWRTLSLRIRRVRDADGRPTRIVGTALDVTETRQLEAQLRDARDLFASVLTAATEQAIIAMDAAGRIRVFNTGAERLLGLPAEEAIGSTLDRFLDPAELLARCDALGVSDPVEALVTVARLGQPETRRWTARTSSGGSQQLSLTVTAMTSNDGTGNNVSGFIGVASDVTAQQRAEIALRSSEERFRLAFDNAPIGMALVSARPATLGRFLKVNYALCRLSGYALSDLLGADFRMLTESDPATSEPRQVADLLAGETSFLRDERRCRHADGRDIWIRMSASLVRDVDGEPNYCVLQIEDITARKDAEQRLIHQTLHDSLTDLPNRVLLSDHLAQALARAHRNGLHVGVLFVDLDNFKDVNDSLGHDAGDELLIDVARRLRGCLRDADTAARLGGDEFVVVCEDLATREEAAAVAERVEQALDIAIDVRGHKVSVSASLGVAISDGSDRAEDMLRKADSAMYRAKEHGRGRYEVFNPDLQARALRQVSLEADLRRALAGDELRLYYQASYNLRRGTLVGVEALLRWQHPDRGLLAPVDFLDVAEDRRLMIPLGEWVLRSACAQASEWHRQFGERAPEMSVNISSRQLGRHELTRVLDDILRETGVRPDRLCLELTERQVLGAAQAVQDDLDGLSDLGVTLAVDDFGTGFANIDYLRRVPFRVLKMDRSYVGGLGTDRTDTALTAGIVALGHSLDLTVVAEGVETTPQRRHLRKLGCDLAQGYLLHRPAPASAMTRLLEASFSPGRVAQPVTRGSEGLF